MYIPLCGILIYLDCKTNLCVFMDMDIICSSANLPVCVRRCLVSEDTHGKARGQYGQASLWGESAYELRFFLGRASPVLSPERLALEPSPELSS